MRMKDVEKEKSLAEQISGNDTKAANARCSQQPDLSVAQLIGVRQHA